MPNYLSGLNFQSAWTLFLSEVNMKGTIVCCLRNLVVEKFGQDKWEKSLTDNGMSKSQMFVPMQDVDDAMVMKVIHSVCANTGITMLQAAEAFGDYWVNVYSMKLYNQYYAKHKDAKSFLLAMDDLHVQMTKTIQNAKPPRFEFEWKNEKTLIMGYKSNRGMIDFLVGLARGVGIHYGEKLKVSKISPEKLQVIFP
jgi:hypothetical protein